ncbi:MAG: hypothetical protein MJ234_00080 [bacterium]|nr:hypothetical protein [bacterium]
MKKFYSLESTYEGEISENTDYGALGCCGRDKLREPEEKEMIPLPYGSEIHFLPGRDPIGIRTGNRERWFQSGEGMRRCMRYPSRLYTHHASCLSCQ